MAGIERVALRAPGSQETVRMPAVEAIGTPLSLLALSADGVMAVGYLDREHRRTRVAVVSSDGQTVLARLDLPGGAPGIGGRPLQFSADRQFLFYGAMEGDAGNVFKMPVAGGAPIQVTRFQADPIARFSVSPDERTIAVSRGPVRTDVVLVRDQAAGVR
jgi:hypothetical protein